MQLEDVSAAREFVWFNPLQASDSIPMALEEDSGNSSALIIELLQSYTKPRDNLILRFNDSILCKTVTALRKL